MLLGFGRYVHINIDRIVLFGILHLLAQISHHLIKKSILEDILSRIRASEIIGRKVILKHKSGSESTGLCPFHGEKTPSFWVNDAKGVYYCFGCGAKGDVFNFISQTQGLSYREAVQKIADELGITLEEADKKADAKAAEFMIYKEIYKIVSNFYKAELFDATGRAAIQYLKGRGLSIKVIEAFNLGYAPKNSLQLRSTLIKNFGVEAVQKSGLFKTYEDGHTTGFFRDRIMFPISNFQGEIIAFGARAVENIMPKYLNSSENAFFSKGNVLYNGHVAASNARAKKEQIIIVEGYMDAIALYEAGFATAVAPMGTALKTSMLESIWKFSQSPVLFFDADLAGRNATQKTVYDALPKITTKHTMRIASPHPYKDPDEVLRKGSSKRLGDILKSAASVAEYILDVELSCGPHKTPEQKASLKQRLSDIENQVQDKVLQREYKTFFKNALWQIFATHSSQQKDTVQKISSAAVNQTMVGFQDNESNFARVIALYPELLLDNTIFHCYSEIDLNDPKLAASQRELLDKFLEDSSDVLFQKDIAFAESIAERYGVAPMKEAPSVEQARIYAKRLVKLLHLKKLEEEIAELLKSTLNDDEFSKLQKLQSMCNNVKSELEII